ncbi:Homeodomain protein [Pseudocohnilembus persalinus]|uniref:Homeodomain protein n=1 Tax=Pseudocohnilembus persalinus TaxID=266149 RepID=A0A0V0QLL4_PSEPJ|nr:Homeodomain protein [Pseudocohnilembus persalinus]|eukprot:KRX03138.1 Homeodomain protein [Pseudocohnilembus persalinus]
MPRLVTEKKNKVRFIVPPSDNQKFEKDNIQKEDIQQQKNKKEKKEETKSEKKNKENKKKNSVDIELDIFGESNDEQESQKSKKLKTQENKKQINKNRKESLLSEISSDAGVGAQEILKSALKQKKQKKEKEIKKQEILKIQGCVKEIKKSKSEAKKKGVTFNIQNEETKQNKQNKKKEEKKSEQENDNNEEEEEDIEQEEEEEQKQQSNLEKKSDKKNKKTNKQEINIKIEEEQISENQGQTKSKKQNKNQEKQNLNNSQQSIQLFSQQQQMGSQSDEESSINLHKQLGSFAQDENKKKWMQKGKTSGKFSEEELALLRNSVCRYAYSKNMTSQELLKFIQTRNDRTQLGTWTQIASVLPDRSVQSCHNVIRRQYNQNNYKGKWSEEEVEELIDLVELHGRKWEKIGELIGRTAGNCRDKYKSIGDRNHQNREKLWTFEEIIKVMKYIEKQLKSKFIDREKLEEFCQQNVHMLFEKIDNQKLNINVNRSKNSQPDPYLEALSNMINYNVVKKLNFEQIKWTKISDKLKTKSVDDIRNKWNNQLQVCILKDLGFQDKDDQLLIEGIKDQYVDFEKEIDWTLIENGKTPEQNKQRWIVLKKSIGTDGIYNQELAEIVMKLKKFYKDKYADIKNSQNKLIKVDQQIKNAQQKKENLKLNLNNTPQENILVSLYEKKYMNRKEQEK